MCERNPCREIGCPNLCCSNLKFEEREERFISCFPDAKEITIVDIPRLGGYSDGVYYMYDGGSEFQGWVLGYIKGDCSHLRNGNCSSYENRSSACDNFVLGGYKCNKMRIREGLKPIEQKFGDLKKDSDL